MKFLTIKDLQVSYSGKIILQHFNLTLEKGEIIALIGENGSGKTTLLRALAGLEKTEAGFIYLNGRYLNSPDQLSVPTYRRKVGLVFQDFALFPHLNVHQNITIGLWKLPKKEREIAYQDIIDLMYIADLSEKYPTTLSGGQQQKVALARTLITQPDLLLLDEPFSNLDLSYKTQLYIDLQSILKEKKITTILVTHDMEDARNVTDRVVII